MRILGAVIAMTMAAGAIAQSLDDGFEALRRLDFDRAHAVFSEHALAGDVTAQIELGFMNAIGEGIPENRVEAYKWFDVAARGGDVFAAQLRDTLAGRMSAEEIAEGKARAEAFTPR